MITRRDFAAAATGILGLVAVVVIHEAQDYYSPDFNDPNPAIRADAVRQASPGSSHRLIERLQDENADVRLLAAMQVRDARSLVPLLNDDHAGVRRQAARSLGEIGDWPVIREALESRIPRVRFWAIQAILYGIPFKGTGGWPQSRSGEVSPVLERIAKEDVDAEVRGTAEGALRWPLPYRGHGP